MARHLYSGFSSWEYQKTGTFVQTDITIVETDLLNHLYTRKGERVMMPEFGTRIPTLVFEPLDAVTLSILEEDILAVVAYDPRVKLVSLRILPDYDRSSVVAVLIVLYIELNLQFQMDLNIQFESS